MRMTGMAWVEGSWLSRGLAGAIGLAIAIGNMAGAAAQVSRAAEQPERSPDRADEVLTWRYQYRKIRHPQGFWAIELPFGWNAPIIDGYQAVFYSESIAPAPKPDELLAPSRSLLRLDVVMLDRSKAQAEAELLANAQAQGMNLLERSHLTVAGRSAERWLFAGGATFDRTSMTLLPISNDLSLLLVGSYNAEGDAAGPARLDRLQRSIELFFDRPTDARSPAQQLMP